MSAVRRARPDDARRRGWCPSLARPMPTGDGLLARVHPPLGILAPAQLRALAEGARRFGNGHVDVTGRGNLQIRGVRENGVAALAGLLAEAGLGDVRDDGGPQRLTLVSPLAGLASEWVDVIALADAVERAGRTVAMLPPKTLVAIDGAGIGEAEADIVLRPDAAGRVGLVLAGGGSIVVPEADAAGAVGAILRAFAASGARRLRELSRVEQAALLRAFAPPEAATPTLLPAVRGEDAGHLVVSGVSPKGEGEGALPDAAHSATPPHLRLPPRRAPDEGGSALSPSEVGLARLRQKERISGLPEVRAGRGGSADTVTDVLAAGLSQLGALTILTVEAPFGRCTHADLDLLAGIAEPLVRAEVRTTPQRGFALAFDDPADARAAIDRLALAGFITAPDDPRRAVAACPGAPACGSGSTPTLLDADRLAQAFRPFAQRGLTAHVSGCAKGCARPGASDLTLVGEDGRYGVVLRGAPDSEPATSLTFEAALERVRRAGSAASLDHILRTEPAR